MATQKFQVELCRNNKGFVKLMGYANLKTALNKYDAYVEWYRTSEQRTDTAFSLQLINNETGERVRFETLPIQTTI